MNRIGWILAVLVVGGVVYLSVTAKEGKYFKPDYHYNSTQPYGSAAFIAWLRQNGYSVDTSTRSLSQLQASVRKPTTIVFVTSVFKTSDKSLDAIDSLLNVGCVVCIGATSFDVSFLERYDLGDRYLYQEVMPLYHAGNRTHPITDSSYHISPSFAIHDTVGTPPTVTTTQDSAKVRWHSILTGRPPDRPVLAARTPIGSGTLIVTTMPELFTNYGVLYDRMWNGTAAIAQYLPKGSVAWDEHYKPTMLESEHVGRLDLIGQHQGLSLAYWVLLGGLATYLVVGGRRRQRAIPTVEAVKNHSLDFVKTITALYWLRRDNVSVGTQMLSQFKKQALRRYRINVLDHPNAATTLSAASGVSLHVVTALVSMCESGCPPGMSDASLLTLSNNIEMFFKHAL